MDFDDVAFGCMTTAFTLAVIAAFFVVTIGLVDTLYFERRAFANITACEARRMEPHRKYLSTHVVCTPINTRQDTTTVQVR